ncbi:unnamed protein product [Cuscuta campestris]|uniref:Gag1-like clamp domain-containing protein n=1 Tax=Cuscuta campestris TaxID=132261 RepID=A0A484LBW3_9ASTE|nr:unnamed protein product [Cuscuta campestris]
MLHSSFCSWIKKLLACMGGCFGCCVKSQPITAVDEPSKGLRIRGKLVKKHNSLSEDLCSSSTFEMENSTVQSQRSQSSISSSVPSNQMTNGQNCSTSSHPEFVNHGYLLWNQTRLQWLASKKPDVQRKVREPVITWHATYDTLLVTNKPFPCPIPLAEIVDLLVDVWEEEALYE